MGCVFGMLQHYCPPYCIVTCEVTNTLNYVMQTGKHVPWCTDYISCQYQYSKHKLVNHLQNSHYMTSFGLHNTLHDYYILIENCPCWELLHCECSIDPKVIFYGRVPGAVVHMRNEHSWSHRSTVTRKNNGYLYQQHNIDK